MKIDRVINATTRVTRLFNKQRQSSSTVSNIFRRIARAREILGTYRHKKDRKKEEKKKNTRSNVFRRVAVRVSFFGKLARISNDRLQYKHRLNTSERAWNRYQLCKRKREFCVCMRVSRKAAS